MRLSTAIFILLSACAIALAQEKVPDPEIERKAFKVADGFEVSLFAADPLIAKPIGMNFDSAGRLWVTSSSLYPQIRPEHPLLRSSRGRASHVGWRLR